MRNFKGIIKVVLIIILFLGFCIGLFFVFRRTNKKVSSTENQYNFSQYIDIYIQTGCPHCKKVEEFMYKNSIECSVINVTEHHEFVQDVLNLCEKFDINNCGTPLLFDKLSNKVIVGDQDIIIYLSSIVNSSSLYKYRHNNTQSANVDINNSLNNDISNNSSMFSKVVKNLTIQTVILAALIDSVNPCAWTALIFLLTSLITLNVKRSKAIYIGLIYITVIYIMYFLLGLGVVNIFIKLDFLTNYLYGLLGILLIIGGVIEIKDAFFPSKWVSLKIPEKSWPFIRKYMRKVTIGAALISGFIVSILEFGCTGGVYMSILAMLADSHTKINATLYLALYNVIFVTPLFLILFLVLLGKTKYKKVQNIIQNNDKIVRFISGVLMIIIAIWALSKIV